MSQLNLTGTTLGRFEVIDQLGRGGMAVVYRARQRDLDRVVALKVLPPELTMDRSYIERFHQEARSVARLEHPNIVPIYEVGEDQGMHFIAMKYISGGTLKEVIEQRGAMTIAESADVLGQIGRALDYAHRQGVIHRDIKPSNMMISEEGWVYLTDFGLARGTSASGLTMTGTVMGTPEYMSPEQAQGLPNVGPPTDIYALGVVLYELLTGQMPFNAETPMAMLAARLMRAPIPPRDQRPDLPEAVEDVIMRALARKPEARFATATELVDALRVAAGLGGVASHPNPPQTPAAGVPALGETLRVPASLPPPPQPTPPYIRQQQAPTHPTPQPRAQPAPFPVPATQPPLPPVNQPPPIAPTAPMAPRGSGAGKWIGIGVGIVVALGLLGGGAAVVLNRENPEPVVVPTSEGANPELLALLVEGDAALSIEGGMPDALAAYQRAVDEEPQSPLALTKLALAYNLRGQWADSAAIAEQLLATPARSDADAALGHTLLADALVARGDATAALAEADTALSLDDQFAFAHAIRSNILAELAAQSSDGEIMESARDAIYNAEQLVEAVEDPILKTLTYNALGVAFDYDYEFTGDPEMLDTSESFYQRASALLPNIALYQANLGAAFGKAEDYDKAERQFQRALDLDDGAAIIHSARGWNFYQQGEYDAAAAAFSDALDRDGEYGNAYYGLGRTLVDQGEYEEAIAQLQTATELLPGNPFAFYWLGWANLYLGLENDADDFELASEYYEAGIAAFDVGIELNERHYLSYNGKGWALQYGERFAESVEAFEASLAIKEDEAGSHNGLGWSLYNLGRHDEAIPHFERAIALDGGYPNASLGLGYALEALDRLDEARAAYEAGIAASPEYTRLQEALDALNGGE